MFNILDLTISLQTFLTYKLTVNPLPIPSEHFVITFDISTSLNGINNSLSSTIFKGNSPKAITMDFACSLYFLLYVWGYWVCDLIRNSFKEFIPTVTVHENNQLLWFNSEIRHHVKCLQKLKNYSNLK